MARKKAEATQTKAAKRDLSSLTAEELQNLIRQRVSNIYDMQKLRISMGNRIVQSFYIKLGIKPGESPKKLDTEGESEEAKEAKKTLDIIVSDYKLITDAIADATKNKKSLSINKALEKYHDELNYISSTDDMNMIQSYMDMAKIEDRAVRDITKIVEAHPMWDGFFSKIKGVGGLMAANCLAYLDITQARRPSAFVRYAGYDCVANETEDGYILFNAIDDNMAQVALKFDENGDDHYYYATKKEVVDNNGKKKLPRYYLEEDAKEYIGDVILSTHGRSKRDTEMQDYTDKDGNTKQKMGLTYNPKLKSKLHLIAENFIRSKDPFYSAMYYDIKNRLQQMPAHKDKSAGHIDAMAKRYIIKIFLEQMHMAWKDIRGEEIIPPYSQGKLGLESHYCPYLSDRANEVLKNYNVNANAGHFNPYVDKKPV